MITSDFFRALGDPIRLEMVKRLSEGPPHNLSSVSEGLKITRQGARKHLQVLIDSHIITIETKGRETHIRLDRSTIKEGQAFIAELEKQWDNRLEALRKFVES